MKVSAGKVSVRPRGDYDANEGYRRLDLVRYKNGAYVCRKSCIGELPTNTEFWMALFIEENRVETDAELSETSTNPIQNDAVTRALNEINRIIENLPKDDPIAIDAVLSKDSINPVQNKIIAEQIENLRDIIENMHIGENGDIDIGAYATDVDKLRKDLAALDDNLNQVNTDLTECKKNVITTKYQNGKLYGRTDENGEWIEIVAEAGKDGVSPTITVSGNTVIVTDSEGVHNYDLPTSSGEPGQDGADGQDGRDGEDGFSPTIRVEENKIIVTDKDGEHEYELPSANVVPPSSSVVDGMSKVNPVGTGSFSMNRKEGTEVGDKSVTEGNNCSATTWCAHAEGDQTEATGESSHAQGYLTQAIGRYSHAEGAPIVPYGTNAGSVDTDKIDDGARGVQITVPTAFGICSHVEGSLNYAKGDSSHAEGAHTVAIGAGSHTEGGDNKAEGVYSHAEGGHTQSKGAGSHSEGYWTEATGDNSHAEGYNNKAQGNYSHAEGSGTSAEGEYSHAEGYYNKAQGKYSHVEGYSCDTSARGSYAHAEGADTRAEGQGSHAEGFMAYTLPNGFYAHAEGYNTRADKDYAHAEGYSTNTKGIASHAEGCETVAEGVKSHAEGLNSKSQGLGSHAEGEYTNAYGVASHAEGKNSRAEGQYSHAEGYYGTAQGNYSHAEGHYTITKKDYSHVSGEFNVDPADTDVIYAIGNGNSGNTRSNAFSVATTGEVKAASTISASTTADYAEYFEWDDNNPNNEDRVGLFVTMSEDKVKIANPDDEYILGIVSGEPFVLGNGDCDVWTGMYLRDEFRRTIYEPAPKMISVEIKEEREEPYIDDNGEQQTRIVEVVVGHETKEVEGEFEGTRPKLNPNYDNTKPYVNRKDRPEWAPIGMLGVLAVRQDGTLKVNGYATVGKNGIATKCNVNDTNSYRVIRVKSDSVAEVIFR